MTTLSCARCGRALESGEERHVPKLVAGATAFAFALFHGGMWAKETLGKPFCPRCARAIGGLAVLVSAGALAAAALGAALWIRGSVAPLAGRGGDTGSAAGQR